MVTLLCSKGSHIHFTWLVMHTISHQLGNSKIDSEIRMTGMSVDNLVSTDLHADKRQIMVTERSHTVSYLSVFLQIALIPHLWIVDDHSHSVKKQIIIHITHFILINVYTQDYNLWHLLSTQLQITMQYINHTIWTHH